MIVDLPNTVMATSQSHIEVGSEGVKGVRVGMDGQKTPSTRVVVDLEKAFRYELVPGADNKFTLKLYRRIVRQGGHEVRAQGAGSKADAGFGAGCLEAGSRCCKRGNGNQDGGLRSRTSGISDSFRIRGTFLQGKTETTAASTTVEPQCGRSKPQPSSPTNRPLSWSQ